MKIYLIDFENVKSKGLTGIDSLNEYDRVIIFYSENADTINFEMHQKVLVSKAEIEYFKVHVGGKNALDFQLSTLLGYLVSTNYYSHIFVISNDRSFDFLHDFWHGKYIAAPDCVVYRTKTIAQAINYAGGRKPVTDEGADTAVFAAASTEQEGIAEENAAVQPAEETESTAAVTEAIETAVKEETPSEVKETKAKAPAKSRAKNPRGRARSAEAKEEEFAISEAELDALEASFSAYSIVKLEDEPVKLEEAAEEKKSAETETAENEAVEKETAPAEETPEEQEPVVTEAIAESKPKQKQGKGFFASLKDALKKADCKPEVVNHISQLMINSDTKEEFHNLLAKDYKQDATEIYKLLRPKYLRLKEMYAAEHPEYVSPDTVITTQPIEEKKNVEEPAAADISPAEKAAEIPAEDKPADAEKAKEKPKAKRSAKGKKAAEDKPEKPKRATAKKKADKPAETEKAAESGDRLAQLLDGKSSSEETELIRQLFREAPTKQQLYIRMIKLFGKSRGCVFYNAIKAEYTSLSEVIK